MVVNVSSSCVLPLSVSVVGKMGKRMRANGTVYDGISAVLSACLLATKLIKSFCIILDVCQFL